LELLLTFTGRGALVRGTMTWPKSCLPGLIFSVAAELECFASGAVAGFAAIATSYPASPVAAVSSPTSIHTAARAELNVNMKIPPRAQIS
jgi:hypothetical protein